MNIYEELKARGFVYQMTDEAAIEKKFTTEKVVFYCGFDPTGSSLHVGHLLAVIAESRSRSDSAGWRRHRCHR